MKPAPISPIHCAACSGGRRDSHHTSAPTAAPKPASGPSRLARHSEMRCTAATSTSADNSPQAVTMSVGKKMSAALKPTSPCLTAIVCRMAMTEVGISVSPAVFSTRNMICALVAVPGRVLSDCNSCIAFSPRGVAALSSPSRLALMFIVIAPCAGCPAGTPGNRWRNTGFTLRAKASTMPARSPIFMNPSHSAMMPTRPSEMSKPVLAASNIAVIRRGKTLKSP